MSENRKDFLYFESGCSASHTTYYEDPTVCPICKKPMQPIFLYGYIDVETKLMCIVFKCPACKEFFIKSTRVGEKDDNGYYHENISQARLAPNNVTPVIFTKYIMDISPKFSDIFNQANAAESYGLDEIAGIGYRKSIEFLIKDYLMLSCKNEGEKESIKDKPLAQCISQDISNENLKLVASRAVWIGNDETHYIRKHTDKDITDLKRLINLTLRWIEIECMTKEAEGIPYIK